MDYLEITGGKKLSGTLQISGAKNAALPILAATILAKNPVKISNLPQVADVKTFLKLIKLLGGSYESSPRRTTVDTTTINNTTATYEIVKTMRASILTLGPLLARFGECKVSLPGGCAIGQRPVDLHLKAMEKMGAKIEIYEGYIHARTPHGLTGATIIFDKITVTGSENVIMAAALAKGKTTIIRAAKEPEVVQLCEILAAAGVVIEGIGTDEINIEGTDGELLNLSPFKVIGDRIEAGTYLCAAAITNSEITLSGVEPKHIETITQKLIEMGFGIELFAPAHTNDISAADSTRDISTINAHTVDTSDLAHTVDSATEISLKPARVIKPIELITTEYPGFPTDMQAQFMALATQANGGSIIEERLFENRFMHVSELIRMGAKIALKGNTATVTGATPLTGADVMATYLRASSALVIAALAARGNTRVHRIYHLDRGYERIEEKLGKLGAVIARKREQ